MYFVCERKMLYIYYLNVKKVWRKIYVIIQQQKRERHRERECVCVFKRNKGIIPMWTHCVLWPVQELLYVPNIKYWFLVCVHAIVHVYTYMLVMWAVCVWEREHMSVNVCVCVCVNACMFAHVWGHVPAWYGICERVHVWMCAWE